MFMLPTSSQTVPSLSQDRFLSLDLLLQESSSDGLEFWSLESLLLPRGERYVNSEDVH